MEDILWPPYPVRDAGVLLRDLRTTLGLSQLEIAILTCWDKAALGKAESGKELRLANLGRVLAAMGGSLEIRVRLPRSPETLRAELGKERLAASNEILRAGRGYRASFATEWTQSLRKSQRWQKLVFGSNTPASMPEAAARTSASRAASPDGS